MKLEGAVPYPSYVSWKICLKNLYLLYLILISIPPLASRKENMKTDITSKIQQDKVAKQFYDSLKAVDFNVCLLVLLLQPIKSSGFANLIAEPFLIYAGLYTVHKKMSKTVQCSYVIR